MWRCLLDARRSARSSRLERGEAHPELRRSSGNCCPAAGRERRRFALEGIGVQVDEEFERVRLECVEPIAAANASRSRPRIDVRTAESGS
jgi:hypothetical protein